MYEKNLKPVYTCYVISPELVMILCSDFYTINSNSVLVLCENLGFILFFIISLRRKTVKEPDDRAGSSRISITLSKIIIFFLLISNPQNQ